MVYCKLLGYPIKDSHGDDVSHQWIITNHYIIISQKWKILPITGVPITVLYCVLPISVVVFHDRVNLTLAYNI